MPKRSVVLLDQAHLPNDKTVSDILQDDKVVGWSYKGEQYYMGLLLKNFHHDSLELSRWDVPFFKKTLKTFSLQFLCIGDSARPITGEVCQEIGTVISTNHVSGSACLKFIIDGHGQELEFRLQDIECVFWVGDMVQVVVGAHAGLEGYIIKRSDDLFHMCQEATNKEVEVSKYYLDRRPLTHILQFQPPMQPDFNPLPKPESLQIGDEMKVVNPHSFCDIISKEVFIIRGAHKGYQAMLYQLTHDTCSISMHGQVCTMVKHKDIATR
ncbi:hypothetical protein BDR06DRAFT_1071983 [Suillus hirtellus]|nr:hypothetical protein BDR06DRAFT_1071983 [Suillus hirtellus]